MEPGDLLDKVELETGRPKWRRGLGTGSYRQRSRVFCYAYDYNDAHDAGDSEK